MAWRQRKRFWKEAAVAPAERGFAVFLDGRPLRTPAKAPLSAPGEALALAIADEWNALEETIEPSKMPMTRRANVALDKVAAQQGEVAAMLAAYGENDLLCYRAAHPEALTRRQAAQWDPLLGWAAETYGAALEVTQGVMHVEQPAPALAALAAPVRAMAPFTLTGLHDLVTISGSLVIGLAALSDAFRPEDLWQRARLDETWQEEQWGRDDESHARSEAAKRDFFDALRFLALLA